MVGKRRTMMGVHVYNALLLLVFVSGVASMSTANSSMNMEFDEFLQRFGKSYSDVEYAQRKAHFEANIQELKRINNPHPKEAAALLPGDTASHGITHFADWSPGEKFGILTGALQGYACAPNGNIPTDEERRRSVAESASAVPDMIDWRTRRNSFGQPILTPVKNQGSCGSCWAFAGVEVVESSWIMANFSQIGVDGSLSVMRVLECQTGNRICLGGQVKDVFDYSLQYLIPPQASDPYRCEKQGTCGTLSCPPGGDITHSNTPGNSTTGAYIEQYCTGNFACDDGTIFQDTLKQILFEYGPVAIGVDARSWYSYQGGIIRNHCSTSVNHAVLLVGYGTEEYPEGNVDYWIVRNSWGPQWGEAGYVRLYRDEHSNTCGLASTVSAATAKPINGIMVGFPPPSC